MNWHKLMIGLLTALFLFMLGGAIASHLLWKQAPLQGFGSASFLFIAGALALLTTEKRDRARLLVVGLLGFLAEVVGVHSGWLFGQYRYTDVLAPNLLGTPVVMICAWFLLLGYVKQLLLPVRLSLWSEAGLGSLWMTLIDLVLDPVAAGPFKFWKWIDEGLYYGIPLHNFVGWFVVSAGIFCADKWFFKIQWRENRWMHGIGLGILVLYPSCAFGYGLKIAGVVGMALVLFHGLLVASLTKVATRTATHETRVLPIRIC
jgi:putative membrane protein